jgi:hypothetical protein
MRTASVSERDALAMYPSELFSWCLPSEGILSSVVMGMLASKRTQRIDRPHLSVIPLSGTLYLD